MDELPIKVNAVIDLERGSVMIINPTFAECTITKVPRYEALEPVFEPASYHTYDYTFFYLNIRENAHKRAKA